MLYLKLLGRYYKDGLFSDSETPIVEEITLGNTGTIRLHSNKQDTLYVMHEDLSNVPKYIKDVFKNCRYTSGALIYEALSKGTIEFPRAEKITVVPRSEACGLNQYYLIYWPIEVDELEELRKMDGKLGEWYRDFEIPTIIPDNWPQEQALSVQGKILTASDVYESKVLSASDVYGLSACDFISNPDAMSLCGSIDFGTSGWDSASDIITKSNLTFKFNNEKEQGKEKENMNNLFGNLRVGKAGSNYSITYFGTVAYKGKTWYNNTVYDCQGMTIDLDLLYLVPTSEINSGDIIEKDGVAYHVNSVADGKLEVVNLVTSKEETLLPGGPFGMTLYSKVYNPMGGMGAKDNNLGNMLLMQSLLGNKGGDNSMLVAMMMMQGGFTFPAMKLPEAPAKRK
jgi:hypothetical protein